MKVIPKMLVSALVQPVAFGLMLFLPAGTFNYWQAWVFLAGPEVTYPKSQRAGFYGRAGLSRWIVKPPPSVLPGPPRDRSRRGAVVGTRRWTGGV